MPRAVVALGSNLGDRLRFLQSAVQGLTGISDTHLLAVSSVYANRAIGVSGPDFLNAPEFLNAVAIVETQLQPADLLEALHRLEAVNDRERVEHWGPRTLDLDLIDYEGFSSSEAALSVPHPRAHDRDFVVVPLAELDGQWQLGENTAAQLAMQIGSEELQVAFEGEWWR